ncbi:UBA domain-containing protein 7 [Madurella mycetomatis]|uniref:UBA domain-containing protein 7 n=1 Tax=Madurella mycetomatis TaxID=100816 RepID=A0A175W586_9PEZI|nr:UBA domain-containing protein 7 [Madurella mycetomatis]
MDDLSGLNWSAPNPAKPAQQGPNPTTTTYPTLRPTPSPFASGRNTPLSAQGSGAAGAKAPAAKPAQDSFGNIFNFGPGKTNANLSLRERQDQLEAEKRRKEEERRKQAQAHYGDGRFFDSLGQSQSGSGSLRAASPAAPLPAMTGPSPGTQNAKPAAESDDDLFAAFNASTKVDNSSHFPPPASSDSPSPAPAPALDLSNPQSWNKAPVSSGGGFVDDDDDLFGLNQLKTKASAPPPPAADEDDFLGDLGKPVDQVRKQAAPAFSREPEPGKPIEDSSSDSEDEQPAASDDPFDRAVAQLVDYGFTPENARRGLTESGAGLDVQAAVNWLLDDAHRQAKEKVKGRGRAAEQPRRGDERASSQSRNGAPSWMREELSGDGTRSRDSRSPAPMDGDFAKTAAAVGTSFLKTANSLWKTGQKKVQKAVAELQQDGDPNQPKWMRSTAQDHPSGGVRRQAADVTDEALMLESGGRPERRQGRPAHESRLPRDAPSRERSPALPARPGQGNQVPRWQQPPQPSLDPRARLNRQAAEEESSQAYVSPARRKKATPQPPPAEAKPPVEPEPDLLFGSDAPQRSRPTPPVRSSQPSPNRRPAGRPSPAPRPAPAHPPRQIPNVSSVALQSSTKHRLDGTAHFKRGDYAAAHASYTSSLTAIPQDHPLAILLLCNRALTALKTGEPRQAAEDADTAIKLIGPGKGEGEHVEVHSDATAATAEKRDMRDLYGKALTRKAEALEQMEKWADAGAVWQLCVESGLGGATATAGRQRCQKALAPKPSAPPAASRPARPRPAATSTPQKSSEAVERLRAANEAAEREGNEKFELADKVDARIAAWRDGKRENLRALLSSLDNVLWEGSGWKKVGLHELVVANKVKIIYMKAIAKTHPDKIAQDATTEVRMIAGTVFSTLNEAWDKFKAENNL